MQTLRRRRRRRPNRFDRRLQRRALRIAQIKAKAGPRGWEPLWDYKDDPGGFAREILGVELWEKQLEIALSVRDNPRTSVAACYASGKTFCAAVIVLWWIYTRSPAMVVTTAPTQRQVRKLLWRDIKKLHRRAKVKLPGDLSVQGLAVKEDVEAMGFSGSTPDSCQGLHEAENVLFVEDEASGIKPEIADGFEGITAAAGSRHLKIGNPVSSDGPFFDSWHRERDLWHLIHITAFDTPNVRAGRDVVKGLVTLEWVEVRKRKWGEGSPLWRCKVLAEFVLEASEKVLPEPWIAAAAERWDEVPDEGEIVLGADIGRSIDPTVIALRRGRRVRILDEFAGQDITLIADRIAETVDQFRAEGFPVSRLNIDASGLGVGVYDVLCRRADNGEWDPGDTVITGVVFGEKAEERDAFDRKLDEMQWQMRELFSPSHPAGIAIDPEDHELREQLNARGWSLNRMGRIKVDTKRELRRKGISSPDRADAAMLALYEEEQVCVF